MSAACVLALMVMVMSWRTPSSRANSQIENAGEAILAGRSNASRPVVSPWLSWQPTDEAQGGPEDKPAEQAYKNIQVLKGLPSSQLLPTMNLIRVSLGVRCDYCHVRTGNNWEWEKDEKKPKKAAREMMQMVVNINKTSFNGHNDVTCNTCHRGETRPVPVPPITTTAPRLGPGAAPAGAPAAEPMPLADKIVDQYVEAIGGRAAIDKLKTRVIKATLSAHLVPPSPAEIYQEAPNKYLAVVTTPKGVLSHGFNGTNGWAADQSGSHELGGAALAELKSQADFFKDMNLKEQYKGLRTLLKEKVGDHEAYLIMGRDGTRRVRLYFDTQTGLLLRKVVLTETMIGQVPETTDYEDYREVDGVKLPFAIHRAQLLGFEESMLKISEVKHNVPVDEAKFNRPASK